MSFQKGDRVRLSASAIESGVMFRDPERVGTVVGVGREWGFYVLWDGYSKAYREKFGDTNLEKLPSLREVVP